MIENNILGIILAGGKSSRFGEDKSIAKLGDKTLLDHTINKIEKEFNEILVISNNKEFNFKNNKIHVVEDCIEGQLGPLVGILTAMKWVIINKKNYKWIASFPCDTPFFDIKLISELNYNTSPLIRSNTSILPILEIKSLKVIPLALVFGGARYSAIGSIDKNLFLS